MRQRDLSSPSKQIIEHCRSINFGRVVFRTRGGEPDPTHPWRSRRTVKVASKDTPPGPEGAGSDFQLRKEHVALLSELSHLSDGTQVSVEIRHGLPFLLEIEQDHQAS